jgi:hypothetical protein
MKNILIFFIIFTIVSFVCFYLSFNLYKKNIKNKDYSNILCIENIEKRCKGDFECLKLSKNSKYFDPYCKNVFIKEKNYIVILIHILVPLLIGILISSGILSIYTLI